jgi:hypothetical protein
VISSSLSEGLLIVRTKSSPSTFEEIRGNALTTNFFTLIFLAPLLSISTDLIWISLSEAVALTFKLALTVNV